MQIRVTRTTAPLHLVVPAMGNIDTLRAILNNVHENAGYPHAVTIVVATSPDTTMHETGFFDAIREDIAVMVEQNLVHNVICPAPEAKLAHGVMTALTKVDAPYSMLLPFVPHSSTDGDLRQFADTSPRQRRRTEPDPYIALSRHGWMRQAMGMLLRSGVSAVVCENTVDGSRQKYTPLHRPDVVSACITNLDKFLIAGRDALNQVGIYTGRNVLTSPAFDENEYRNCAQAALREIQHQTLQALQ